MKAPESKTAMPVTRVKTFQAELPEYAEQEANEWISKTPNIFVRQISTAGSTFGYENLRSYYTLTILYDTLEEEDSNTQTVKSRQYDNLSDDDIIDIVGTKIKDNYNEYYYETFVHDINNLRGDEWIGEVSDWNDPELLERFTKIVKHTDDDEEEEE